MKPSTIDEYIALAKADIYVYLMMTVIIFFILLYIGYRVNWYYIVWGDIMYY